MRKYETMFVLHPEMDEEKQTATVEKFSTLITEHGGEITKSERWGKRRLAYEIDKVREGIYYIIRFNGEPELEKELSRVYKITDGVIRYIIVREEE